MRVCKLIGRLLSYEPPRFSRRLITPLYATFKKFVQWNRLATALNRLVERPTSARSILTSFTLISTFR